METKDFFACVFLARITKLSNEGGRKKLFENFQAILFPSLSSPSFFLSLFSFVSGRWYFSRLFLLREGERERQGRVTRYHEVKGFTVRMYSSIMQESEYEGHKVRKTLRDKDGIEQGFKGTLKYDDKRLFFYW